MIKLITRQSNTIFKKLKENLLVVPGKFSWVLDASLLFGRKAEHGHNHSA